MFMGSAVTTFKSNHPLVNQLHLCAWMEVSTASADANTNLTHGPHSTHSQSTRF